MAGGLRQTALRLVKCETVDLEVPASSEIVIEGRILPHVREDEGPFGEFSGYYAGGVLKMPIIEVSALTQRANAIYQAANTGVPITENHVIKEIPWEAATFSDIRKKYPEVRALHYHPAGCAQFLLFVSVKQRYKGLARNIITSLLGNPLPPKIVVVVDEDIDVFDLNQVVWAITTRSQPDEDLIVLSGMAAGQLDPSTKENEISSVMGIDATRPFGRAFQKLSAYPE